MTHSKYKLLSVIVFVLISYNSAFCQNSSNFLLVDLPRGISVKLPKQWRLIENGYLNLMNTTVEANLNLNGIQIPDGKTNLIAANSMPTTTFASIKIDSIIPPSIPYTEVQKIDSNDLKMIEKIIQNGLIKVLKQQNYSLIEFIGCHLDNISNKISLVTEYRRTGLNGSVFVQINQIMTDNQEVVVTLSYREAESPIWKAVVKYIRNSVIIK